MKHFFFIQLFRNIKQDKFTFFINLFGLSFGLVCTLLIYLWIIDEFLIDKFHEKDSRLYQVVCNDYDDGEVFFGECTPGLLSKALAEEFPEIGMRLWLN